MSAGTSRGSGRGRSAGVGARSASLRQLWADPDALVTAPAWEPQLLTALAAWDPRAPAPARRLLAYAWAAPITLVGLVCGAAAGVRPVLREGVLLFAPAGWITGAVLRGFGYAAGTFGHAMVATHDPGPALFAHELVHTRQAERLGVFMAPLYLGLLAVYGYGRHPMERAARSAGRRCRAA